MRQERVPQLTSQLQFSFRVHGREFPLHDVLTHCHMIYTGYMHHLKQFKSFILGSHTAVLFSTLLPYRLQIKSNMASGHGGLIHWYRGKFWRAPWKFYLYFYHSHAISAIVRFDFAECSVFAFLHWGVCD